MTGTAAGFNRKERRDRRENETGKLSSLGSLRSLRLKIREQILILSIRPAFPL
jgi:hypothetical protein